MYPASKGRRAHLQAVVALRELREMADSADDVRARDCYNIVLGYIINLENAKESRPNSMKIQP